MTLRHRITIKRQPRNGKKNETKLSASERKDAQRRSAPGVAVVYEAIRQEAETELGRPNLALFWSGLAAGLSMGFSFLAQAILQSGLPVAETGRVTVIIIITYLVGIAEFPHIIAGSTEMFYALMTGSTSLLDVAIGQFFCRR